MRRAFIPHLLSIQSIFNSNNVKTRVIEYKKGAGFTLVEIMVVVSALLILISLSLPNILRSRIIAYEGVALANIKTLSNACQLYHADQGSYPNALDTLVSATPAYIDSSFGSSTNNTKQRYQFIYTQVNADSFTINANPTSSGLLKGRYFYTDEGGIIRAKSDGPAGANDEIVQ